MATPDVVAPSLVEAILLSHSGITISGAPGTITLTAHLSDDISGISNGMTNFTTQIRFVSPHGQIVDGMFDTRDSGNALNGYYSADLTLGRYAEDGIWTVEYLMVADNAGNWKYLYPDDPGSLLAGLDLEVHNAESDVTPPTASAISLSDTLLDIDAGESTVIITGRFVDAPSGLSDGITFYTPQIRFVSAGGQIVDGLFDMQHPVSGTLNDGVFRAAISLDPNMEAGNWRVEYLLLPDQAGNIGYLYEDDLGGLSFEVKNTAADTAPPTLESIVFGTPTLNADGTTAFVVHAEMRDNLSGLSNMTGVPAPQVRLVSASGQIADGVFDIDNPFSGNSLHGVFQATVTLNSFAETGVWRVEYMFLADNAGNIEYLYPETSELVPNAGIVLGSDLPETIDGTPTEDAIYGYGGDDALGGENGDDTLNGGDGDDTVDGGAGDDTIVGGHGAGNDIYKGGAGFDRVTYTSATSKITVDLQKGKASGKDINRDTLKQVEGVLGGQAGDKIKGSLGANILDGYTGKDKLIGGKGKDTFLFSTELGKDNVDIITDFSRKDDTIALDIYVFTGLDTGKLAKGGFVVGKAAKDQDDRIVHDSKKGVLIYDENGSQEGGDVVFAKIGKGVSVGADDFFIV